MKLFNFFLFLFLAFPIFAEEKGRLDREQFDFRYTSIGINFNLLNFKKVLYYCEAYE